LKERHNAERAEETAITPLNSFCYRIPLWKFLSTEKL